MERRLAVRGIIYDDGKVFCVRQKNYRSDGLASNDYWNLPGGGVDPGEPFMDAIKREMVEETGIEPVVGALLYVQQFMHAGREHVEFFFHLTNTDDYRSIDLTKTTHGTAEIEEFAFIDPNIVPSKPALLSTEDIGAQITENRPTKFFSYL